MFKFFRQILRHIFIFDLIEYTSLVIFFAYMAIPRLLHTWLYTSLVFFLHIWLYPNFFIKSYDSRKCQLSDLMTVFGTFLDNYPAKSDIIDFMILNVFRKFLTSKKLPSQFLGLVFNLETRFWGSTLLCQPRPALSRKTLQT